FISPLKARADWPMLLASAGSRVAPKMSRMITRISRICIPPALPRKPMSTPSCASSPSVYRRHIQTFRENRPFPGRVARRSGCDDLDVAPSARRDPPQGADVGDPHPRKRVGTVMGDLGVFE